MTRIKIPTPVSGGVLLSYKCQARCRHCIYACSPEWKADWISEEDLERGLSQLRGKIQPSAWGPQSVGLSDGLHITGGEPFLNFELLLTATRMAEKFSIPSTFVETNSVWCTDDDITTEKLQKLRVAGLKGIMISVNPFYAEYVPFERTERCIRISHSVFGAGNVMVYQQEYYRQFMQMGVKDRLPFEDYLEMARGTHATGRVEMFFMGRATYELKPFFPTHPAHRFFHVPCQPTFLRDWHNHFDNYGCFMPGFCGGISLGNWLNLDELLEEGVELEEHPVLGFLIDDNMQGLFQFAQDLGYQEAEEGYLSKCGLCLDIRKHLFNKQDFSELAPAEFYSHLE